MWRDRHQVADHHIPKGMGLRCISEDWQTAIEAPHLEKEGKEKDYNSHRGISLLSHVSKMYAKILEL